MAALTSALVGAGCVAAAFGLQRGAVYLFRRAWLARKPVSGETSDSAVYHRNLWTPGETDLIAIAALLLVSGLLAAASLLDASWPLWPAVLPWLAALAWDLASWQRAAATVKFVAWQRGWQRSMRRVAISDLREINIVERRHACYLALTLRNGKSVKLPRTGALFGGAAALEKLAHFVRLQMDLVADNRRRAAADKRAALRRAMQPMAPAHPATKLDPSALPHTSIG